MSRARGRAAAMGGGLVALTAGLIASAAYGPAGVSFEAVWTAVAGRGGSELEVLVRTVRVPRALLAAGVGAALSVAGAVMQVLTRNPLASPGILGLNGGAALAVVAAGALGVVAGPAAPWIALAGAAAAGTLVQAVAGVGHAGPIRLTLVGAALSIFLTSLTQGVLVVDEATLDQSRRWLAGSVGGRSAADLGHIAPFLVAGLLGACALGRPLSAMALGDEVGTSLGVRPGRVRLAGSAVVVALAGASVAVAGPVGFVGLAVPHVSRFLVGEDQRWVLAGAAVLGAGGLVAADLAARVVAAPNELPLGAVTAMVGAPFFVWLARTVWRRA